MNDWRKPRTRAALSFQVGWAAALWCAARLIFSKRSRSSDKQFYMVRQGFRVAGENQKAILAMGDYLLGGAVGAGDGGQAELHAFQVDDAEAFIG